MGDDSRKSQMEVYAFAALSCALSWTLWGLIIASDRGWVAFKVPVNPWGSFGPAVAALILVARSSGTKGVFELLSPLLSWRFRLSSWLIVLGLPVGLVAVSLLIFRLSGGELAIEHAVPWAQLLLLLPVILVVGGPLGEEIGWRGFALPRLLEKHGPLAASLIVAAIWMLWHVPLFWMPGAAQQGSSIPVFLAMLVGISILTTWIYLGTRRSLLAVVMFHFSINATTFSLSQVAPTVDSAAGFQRTLMIVIWLAALAAALRLHRWVRAEE